MDSLRVLYRDVDRTPYLFTLRHCAQRLGLSLDVARYDMALVSAGPTGQEWGDLLTNGDVDVIAENYWGLQSYRARGLPVLCVASNANVWTEKLLVAPGIESLDDLRGKRFALRSPGPQALLPKVWLADIGLGPFVEVVTYSDQEVGRWQHWTKVADGDCQACFVTNVYADRALEAGLKELPYAPFPFEGGNVTLTTTEAVAAEHWEAVQTLVDAAFDATALFAADPKAVIAIMRDECAGLLAEHFGELDDDRLERLYEVLRDELADIPIPTAEGIANARRIRLETAPELEDYNPMIMWELSFARHAIAKRGLRDLGASEMRAKKLSGRNRLISSAAIVAASAALAACSSGSSSTAAGSNSASAATTSSPVASGVAVAQRMVAQLEAATTRYPVPTASVRGVSQLHGRTVYYIPLVPVPEFIVTGQAMKQAMAAAGLKLQVCDGQGQPSAVAGCVSQAEGAHAAGIILDAIPYGMVQNALDGAKAKGIALIIADQNAPAATLNTDQVSYAPGVADQPSAIAWWTIADSKGTANTIIAEEADSPSSIGDVTSSLPIYHKYCPGCKVTVKQITVSASALLASDTSSNLLADPDADYYYTEFENGLQPAIQGVQQSGRSVSLSVAGGSVDGLGLLRSGSMVKAVVVVDRAYAGWALTDQILRMATKTGPVGESFPSRLFTTQNIGSIQVTAAAQSSGAWFGDSSYQGAFTKLWGVG